VHVPQAGPEAQERYRIRTGLCAVISIIKN
jgi:hypothetical protein